MSSEQLPVHSGPNVVQAAPQAGRVGLLANLGTLLSAVVASSCCWLPLLLLAVGVSGAGIASTLAAYRPLFIAVTFLLLGAAFFVTYRPLRFKSRAAGAGDCCATEAAAADCCAPSSGRFRVDLMAVNKVMLWGVTALVLLFVFFPGIFTSWLTPAGAVTDDMQRSVVHVDGMTCESCAPMVAEAIRRAPGVLAVEVDYAAARAVIGSEPGSPLARDAVLDALQSLGFPGRFVE